MRHRDHGSQVTADLGDLHDTATNGNHATCSQCHTAKQPQVDDPRLLRWAGLTLHNPNTLRVDGPEIRIRPVGVRQVKNSGVTC